MLCTLYLVSSVFFSGMGYVLNVMCILEMRFIQYVDCKSSVGEELI
jgi:hypothetical protein